ncbi:MAG: hypothetical protein KatS3mg061_2182 [Dehalococcoidia bacterium]|nr:MAG: hypothetical protein KatS3mg061_2182 [Dehalococcoidia bacterium]
MRAVRLVALGLLMLLAAMPALAQGVGTLSGRVTDGSADRAPVAGLTVTLLPVSNTGPGQRQQTTTGPDGSYHFSGLNTASGQFYVVWTEYEGARFQEGPLQFAPGSSTLTQDLTVYTPTENDPGLRVLRNAIVIVPAPAQRQLTVLQLVDLENPSSQAWVGRPVGQGRQTLRFGLPASARGLQVLAGLQVNAVVQTADGFADTLPVSPGGREVVFQYLVDYLDNGILFTLPVHYPTEQVRVLLADGDWRLTADGLRPAGMVEQGGQRFQQYQGERFAAGQEIRLVIQGAGLTGQVLDDRTLVTAGVGGAIALVTTLAVAVPLLRRRRRQVSPGKRRVASAPPGATRPPEPRADEREALIAAIADLDDRHEAGELNDEEWQRLRAAKKEALIALIREVRGIE